MTVDLLYSNPSVTNIGATTLGKYPQYKAIIITNVVDATTPGTTLFLGKGDSGYGGCAWGTYSGYRQYTFASDGTISWAASSASTVIPWMILGLK